MSDHYHLVVYVERQRAQDWSEREVIRMYSASNSFSSEALMPRTGSLGIRDGGQ